MAWLENVAAKSSKVKKQKPKGAANIFRSNLYKVGKTAGTVKVLPGVANSQLGRRITSSRSKLYPTARAIGDVQALLAGNFISSIIGRAGRVAGGSLSGRAIDMAVRPLNMGPLASRFARVQLGKQFAKSNPLDKAIQGMITNVVGTVKMDGPALNNHVRSDIPLKKRAQMLLLQAEANARAFAPDVSSGQYLVGFKEGPRTYAGPIDEGLVKDVGAFRKHGFSEIVADEVTGKNRRIYRDIFGFTKPGEARSFILDSMTRIDVRRTKGQNAESFMEGYLLTGGDLFPWIWAVEYGGNIPYIAPQKYARRNSRKQRYGDSYTGRSESSITDVGKANLDIPLDQYAPKNQYIPPTFFLTRAANAAVKAFPNYIEIESAKVTGEAQKYYKNWLSLAKKNQKAYSNQIKGKSQISYIKGTESSKYLHGRYMLDKRTREDSIMSYMEQKIPGPRINSATGAFYDERLANAIGVKYLPEEFEFTLNVPMRKNDTNRMLRKAAESYIRAGGKPDMSADRISQVSRQLRRDLDVSEKESLRYIKIFNTMRRAQNFPAGQRSSEYLDKVFNISTQRKGNKLVMKAARKSGKKRVGNYAYEKQLSRIQSLSKSIYSSKEIDEIFRLASEGDF